MKKNRLIVLLFMVTWLLIEKRLESHSDLNSVSLRYRMLKSRMAREAYVHHYSDRDVWIDYHTQDTLIIVPHIKFKTWK